MPYCVADETFSRAWPSSLSPSFYFSLSLSLYRIRRLDRFLSCFFSVYIYPARFSLFLSPSLSVSAVLSRIVGFRARARRCAAQCALAARLRCCCCFYCCCCCCSGSKEKEKRCGKTRTPLLRFVVPRGERLLHCQFAGSAGVVLSRRRGD